MYLMLEPLKGHVHQPLTCKHNTAYKNCISSAPHFLINTSAAAAAALCRYRPISTVRNGFPLKKQQATSFQFIQSDHTSSMTSVHYWHGDCVHMVAAALLAVINQLLAHGWQWSHLEQLSELKSPSGNGFGRRWCVSPASPSRRTRWTPKGGWKYR